MALTQTSLSIAPAAKPWTGLGRFSVQAGWIWTRLRVGNAMHDEVMAAPGVDSPLKSSKCATQNTDLSDHSEADMYLHYTLLSPWCQSFSACADFPEVR